MKNKNRIPALWSLIFAVVIFGSIGTVRRFIPLPSSVIALVRSFIASVFLLGYLLVTGEKLDWQAIKKYRWLLLLCGCTTGINWMMMFEAYQYTSVAVTSLCYYMAPIFVIVAAPFVFKEKLTLRKGLCVLIALTGMVLVSGVFQMDGFAPGAFRGIFLALGAALLYGAGIVISKMMTEIKPIDRIVVQLVISTLVVLPYTLLTEDVAALTFTTQDIILLCVLGIVHTGIAYTIYFGTLNELKAQTLAIFSYIDPAVSILLATFVLKEGLSISGLVGAVMIILATVMSQIADKKEIS